ncbi:DUF1365 family protein [Sinorhizobium sp. BG8]|uniref:DUF1365 domain-containing protein n=1 Tax=Sinorhizobium sp. BG8 TaxID=2613773 RepID=UPI00193E6C14|nr:DUF1365 family protein [Sinorhizobium sp. BG8]QRM57539.1 DUF1365 domain-containing protein [Sinorhizobium sp. BG8]
MSGVSAIYVGRVMHARHRPRRHALNYRVFSLLLDLDELPELDNGMRFFGYNRWAVFSFWDKDHGNGRPRELRNWIHQQLLAAEIAIEDITVRIVCYPRILGYVFNPLTVYFCHGPDGALRAILYEVCNTFRERHTYVIPVKGHEGETIRQSCVKELYVSPFVPMGCRYNFRIEPPGDRVLIGIQETDAEGLLLVATFSGSRRELSDRRLLRTFIQYPLMTLKVMAGIHWEAFRLWAKGNPVYRHRPARDPVSTTIVATQTSEVPQHEPS